MREITFDTETTGMDPDTGHRIVEIGCVELIDKVRTGKFFHTYLNPERDVPKGAEQVHGLSTEFLRNKPLFKSVANEFLDFIADDILVIHNAVFDMKFINSELDKVGKQKINFARAVDTLPLARRTFPGAKASLDALCQRFNISLEKRDKHGALLDAELLAEVYLELCGGKQGAMVLEEKSTGLVIYKESKKKRPARKYQLSAEEIAAHEAFLKSRLKIEAW